MQIKARCWRYETIDGAYFVKYYDSEIQQQKVRTLHNRLEQVDFPYSIPITSNRESPYIVQRWLEGHEADFSNRADRTQTLQMLRALHTATENWHISSMPQQQLVEKWYARYAKFQEQEAPLKRLMGDTYEAVLKQAEKALRTLEPIEGNRTCVLHGDVVHHNFLLGKANFLIDFDLASIGFPEEELILWMHRVLPHIHYDIAALMKEQPYTQIVTPYVHFLCYPNEVLREWLYVLQLTQPRASLVKELQKFTERAVAYFPQLNEQVNRMQS